MSDKKVISRIEAEIGKIDNKESKIFFFVIDTKGNPNGNLSYIYNLALILKNHNYDVNMLYQEEEEFIGVKDWMGEEYANLPHYDIANDDVEVSASDVLFIPEIFSNIMIQTKKLPCKRIAILQNFNFVLEQTPMVSQWGDLGIMEALTNSDTNGDLIKDVFPYVKTTTVDPFIDKVFGETKEPKKMIINILAKNQGDINKIIKPFYWKYPMYKWVSFRDLRGFPKEDYARMLREAAITIWIDEDTSFGYSALEAMKSGSIVIAKTTDNVYKWMEQDDKSLKDCCVWFDSYHSVHKIIASVVRACITDNVPSEIGNAAKETVKDYTIENTEKQLIEYIEKVLENRKGEMKSLITYINSENKEKDNDEED